MSDQTSPSESLPDDIQEWLNNTYTPGGQIVWKRAYDRADAEGRERMIRARLNE